MCRFKKMLAITVLAVSFYGGVTSCNLNCMKIMNDGNKTKDAIIQDPTTIEEMSSNVNIYETNIKQILNKCVV